MSCGPSRCRTASKVRSVRAPCRTISRAAWANTPSLGGRPMGARPVRTDSITSSLTPALRARGSWCVHSYWLPTSRAVLRIAISRTAGSNPRLEPDVLTHPGDRGRRLRAVQQHRVGPGPRSAVGLAARLRDPVGRCDVYPRAGRPSETYGSRAIGLLLSPSSLRLQRIWYGVSMSLNPHRRTSSKPRRLPRPFAPLRVTWS